MYNIIIHINLRSKTMNSIIFFPGYKTPVKRYISYFPGFKLCEVTNYNYNCGDSSVLTHSIGLVNALIYFSQQNIKPKHIVAMDPPHLSNDSMLRKIKGGDKSLAEIYQRFIDSDINMKDWNITIYRNINKKNDKDNDKYSEIIYYNEDTHYPYQIRNVRNSIVAKLT